MSQIVISERAVVWQARPSLAPCATFGCAAPARTLICTGHAFCGSLACTVRSMLLLSGSWLSFQALSLPSGAMLVDAGLSAWATFVMTCNTPDLLDAARLGPAKHLAAGQRPGPARDRGACLADRRRRRVEALVDIGGVYRVAR